MPESVDHTYRQFAMLKKKIGIKDDKDIRKHFDYFYMILLFYPLITMFLLIYLKPDFVCEKKLFDDIDLEYTRGIRKFYRRRKIDYSKLLSVFLLLQLPLALYYIFTKNDEKDE